MKAPTLLALTALSGFAACSSSSKKPVTPSGGGTQDAGQAFAFKIGMHDAFALKDGDLTLPNDGKVLAVGHVEEAGELLVKAGLPRDQLALSIQPLLVKDGEHVLLFDTGAGGAMGTAGTLAASLGKTGVAAAEVTDIFISHAHPDHTGGLLTADGALIYPNATIHLSAPEWAFLQSQTDAKAVVDGITAKVVPFEPGAEILPDVRAVATPGHTPGHSSYVIGTGADQLFYLGDLAHHSIVSVQQPSWQIQFDGDHAAAGAMRQQTLSALAADHMRVYVVHFPFPGLGHFADQGGTVVWQAE